MAERIGGLLADFRRAEPRGAVPSGWALALDAAVAVGAAATAVFEVAQRKYAGLTLVPTGPLIGRSLGAVVVSSTPLHISPLTLIAAAMTALPLAARQLYPITAWLAIIAAIIAVHPTYVPPVALGTAVYGAYSAVARSRYRNLAIVTVLGVAVATAATLGNQLPRFPGRLTAIFAIAPAAAAGLGVRVLRRRLADSTAEHEAATRQALAAERARIASELHDVVTHNVAVMVVQAGAARTVLASAPADTEAALLAVEASGRSAMAELRNLLGLLSPPADGTDAVTGAHPHAALRPQPGLHELDALIGRVSAAGLPVRLQVSGEPRPLPPGADLAAYRVVQEGLTNVLRHAGRAAASVAVQWGEELVITVSDDGAGSWLDSTKPDSTVYGNRVSDETGPCGAPGRGLLGLGERLSLYGGELDAGPLAGGGWRVRAVLPA